MHADSAVIPLQKYGDPSKELAASLVYNHYWEPNDYRLHENPEYKAAPKMVRAIIREFVNQKKIVGSMGVAGRLIRASLKDGVVITDDEIQMAYDIGAGGGCEYEWPYE